MLNDSLSSRDLLAHLPLTLIFSDYNQTEKTVRLPFTLTSEGAPAGAAAKAGDLTLFVPWGNLSVFYKDFPYYVGVVVLGHVETGWETIAGMNGEFQVTIEKIASGK